MCEVAVEVLSTHVDVSQHSDGDSHPHTHEVTAFAEDFVEQPQSEPRLVVADVFTGNHRHSVNRTCW